MHLEFISYRSVEGNPCTTQKKDGMKKESADTSTREHRSRCQKLERGCWCCWRYLSYYFSRQCSDLIQSTINSCSSVLPKYSKVVCALFSRPLTLACPTRVRVQFTHSLATRATRSVLQSCDFHHQLHHQTRHAWYFTVACEYFLSDFSFSHFRGLSVLFYVLTALLHNSFSHLT